MTILNKKAFALAALVMSSVVVQAVDKDDAKKPLNAKSRVAIVAEGLLKRPTAFLKRQDRKTVYVVAGAAVSAALIAYAVKYYQAQQKPKPVYIEPVAEVVIEPAIIL
ncbi:hypothetical protein H0X48_03980 [Candidatus Dependentiae bacterium]|nr:hypothetical protein [Candidatus Dependentiae bacterium]